MTSQELQWTQKYRPKNLGEYIGNKFMKMQLSTLIERNRVPQTIMFFGEKGTGKTTIARLLVKNLMCENPKDGEACGQCTSCSRLDDQYITSGKAPQSMLIKELNIADLRGVDHADDIVADMKKKVAFNRKRIFILDEMQQASKEAQSAFLKIMEEPVPNLYVIMCTTHPDKITEALASRFKRFQIKRPDVKEIAQRLERISHIEGVNYDKGALRIIAGFHKNNPRESINQLEILAHTTDFSLTVTQVEQQLEIVSKDVFRKFLTTCATGNLNNVVGIVDNLEQEGIDTISFIEGLGDFIVDLLKIRSGINLDMYTLEKVRTLRKYVKEFTESDMVSMLKVLKDYSSVSRSMDFQLYALAAEIMSCLKVEETVNEIDKSKAGTIYRNQTKKINKQNEVQKEIKVADKAYIEKQIPSATKVVGIPDIE